MRTVRNSSRLPGVYLVPGGCTWSQECVPIPGGGLPGPGGVPGPRGVDLVWGVYLVLGGVPGPGG